MAKIYVIDDDDGLLHMVSMMLERGGHTVLTINNPADGLQQITQHPPDLLILDVMMPDMSGHDVIRQLRTTKGAENLPIIILTARSQEVDRKTALNIGATAYLNKPISSRELVEKVDAVLAQSAPAAAKRNSITAVYGLRGGMGQTTIATNLAAALHRTTKHEVCLIDLSPSSGQAARHLRLKPEYNWSSIHPHQKIEWGDLQKMLTPHSSGLQLLAAPLTPQLPTEPSAKMVKHILSLLQKEQIFVVIDLPNMYSPALIAGLSMADVSLHVITPDPLSVKTAVHLDALLDNSSTPPKHKSYILNHPTPEVMMPTATVERGLGVRVSFDIAHDRNQARALARGVPLGLTTAISPMPTAVTKMAEIIWERTGD